MKKKSKHILKELIVKVTEDGNWIMPDSKGKIHVWSSAMPISSMATLIAIYFGLSTFEEFQFKITCVKEEMKDA
jgi:hypothetical protein